MHFDYANFLAEYKKRPYHYERFDLKKQITV